MVSPLVLHPPAFRALHETHSLVPCLCCQEIRIITTQKAPPQRARSVRSALGSDTSKARSRSSLSISVSPNRVIGCLRWRKRLITSCLGKCGLRSAAGCDADGGVVGAAGGATGGAAAGCSVLTGFGGSGGGAAVAV